MYKACQKDLPAEVPIKEYLKTQALQGSRMALQDLKTLDKDQAVTVKRSLSIGYAGVGATWYNDSAWTHGLSRQKLWSQALSIEALGPNDGLENMVVNTRGDRLLQAAAAIGADQLVERLLPYVDVNQSNAKGETALLCACRSGHADVVKVLLDNGARAIQSKNGESPLHWLLSFDEKINFAALGKDLIERGGAKVEAFTTEAISYSCFPGSIDVDFRPAGTPLMWAVHDNLPGLVSFFLANGADPEWQLQENHSTPLQWAAFYHHTDCLKFLIAHCEATVDVPMTTDGKRDLRHAVWYRHLVHKALHAADKFSMILRNSANYRQQLKSTLELLQSKTKMISFELGERETLLHFAAREAHDEACEIILELGWKSGPAEEINHPAGPVGYTPLHESVRWNRRPLFHILRRSGAEALALAYRPYDESRTWSSLHLFADQAHNDNLELVEDLVAAGVPVDGDPTQSIETPLHIAVRRNAFCLADLLRKCGAAIDALCTHSTLLINPHPLTGLGHIVVLNARHSFHGLRYMIASGASFIVEPARGLSALHLCAMVPNGLVYVGGAPLLRENFDWETNSAISLELRTGFAKPEQLNMQCKIEGKTALHLAAENGNLGVVTELVNAGADKTIRCEQGEAPADVARRVWKDRPMWAKLQALLN
jgi:ankyrin repeat protein